MLDYQVIVRSAKERSLPLCIKALTEQTDQILVVEETPKLKSMYKVLEIGAHSKNALLIVVDGDVVLYSESLKNIVDEASKLLNPTIYRISFPLLDKFVNSHSGCHVYQTACLKPFFEHFKTLNHGFEEALLTEVAKTNGLKEKTHILEVGTHDFDQYYNHIYIKYYRKAVLTPEKIPQIIDAILQNRAKTKNDLDFALALYGLYSGDGQTETFQDASLYPAIDQLMPVKEKAPITLS